MKKNILVVCPNSWDKFYLEKHSKKYNFFYLEEAKLLEILDKLSDNMLDEILLHFNVESLNAAISTDDNLGIFLASCLSQELKCSAPDSQLVLKIQNKWAARNIQKKIVPSLVPDYEFIPIDSSQVPKIKPPYFIKPTKGVFSFLSTKIHNDAAYLDYLTGSVDLYKDRLKIFEKLKSALGINIEQEDGFLCEQELQGQLLTLEGYASESDVHILGIVDSVLYPDTRAFRRFEFPSKLPDHIQSQLEEASKKLMKNFEFENGCFNIEYYYDDVNESIHLLEINARMSSVFSGLFDTVLGYTGYDALLNIVDKDFCFKKNNAHLHSVAAAFVLRHFSDAIVKSVPDEKTIDKLKADFDMQINIDVRPGDVLSKTFPGHGNYKYATLHLSANDWDTLHQKFSTVEQMLDFEFVTSD